MDEQATRAASPTRTAESRFVALLEFDLGGSTRISKSLSESDELDLQRDFRSVVTDLVNPYGVKIENRGDGGLIVFGYPEARIDAAEIAVRTGLKLIERVRSLRVDSRIRLDLRVAIVSGRVTVDRLSDALSRWASVSPAARLVNHAQPGHLLIDEPTRLLVGTFFEYETLGLVELDDLDPMEIWRVVRETAHVSRFTALRSTELAGEIVGREEILERLSAAWRETRNGQGSAICLVGDSGMGKSRLARALLERAKQDGALGLEIDCTPSSGNTPLLPIGVLLRRTAGIAAGATDEAKVNAALALLTPLLGEHEANESVTYLAPLFGIASAPIPDGITREEVRQMTMAKIVGIVCALGGQKPLAILCEDLHWADDTTAEVVRAVAGMVRDLPVMVVATRWPRPVTRIDLDAITAGFTTIAVEPLAASNAADLVQGIAGDQLSAERVDDIVSRCGGVPLLLEEVTRSTVDRAPGSAVRRTAQRSGSTVPPELQLVVESRLEQLPHLRDIVEAASALGREFPVGVLEAVVSPRDAEVSDALSRFAEYGLFAQPAPTAVGRVRFRHALIRDAVYETLVSKSDRRVLHSRAADALLSKFHGTPDASPDILAQHLRIAERLIEAIRIRRDAGEDTFKRGSYVEALGHCDGIQSLLDEIDDKASVVEDAFRSCVLRAMVVTGLHGYSAPDTEVAYREALSMCGSRADAASRYPVTRGLATVYLVRGALKTAHRYALRGLALAERSQRAEHRIDAMSVLAYATLYAGRLDACRYWIDRCLELYDAEGGERFRYPVPQDAKTAALALLPTVAWLLGDAADAERAIELGLAHVEKLGRDFDKALLHAWTAGTRYTQRRYRDALNHAGIAYMLGKERKFEEWEGVGAMMALISQSALAATPEQVQQAVATAHAFNAKGVGLNASYFLWGIARGLLTLGDTGNAAATLITALNVAKASGETRMNPEIWLLQAEIEQDPVAASCLVGQAYDLALEHGAVANALRAATAIILRGSRAADDIEWARTTLNLLNGDAPSNTLPVDWMHESLARARPIVQRLRDSHAPASESK